MKTTTLKLLRTFPKKAGSIHSVFICLFIVTIILFFACFVKGQSGEEMNNVIHTKIILPVYTYYTVDYHDPKGRMKDTQTVFPEKMEEIHIDLINVKTVFSGETFSGNFKENPWQSEVKEIFFKGIMSPDKSVLKEIKFLYMLNNDSPYHTVNVVASFTLKNIELAYSDNGNISFYDKNKKCTIEGVSYSHYEQNSSSNSVETINSKFVRLGKLEYFQPSVDLISRNENSKGIDEKIVRIDSKMEDMALTYCSFTCPAYDGDDAFTVTYSTLLAIMRPPGWQKSDPPKKFKDGREMEKSFNELKEYLESYYGVNIKSLAITEDMSLNSHTIESSTTAPLQGKAKDFCDCIKEIMSYTKE